MDDRSKLMNIGTFACWISCRTTGHVLSSEMRYPLCWCVFAQGKIGERCKYKYDHGIQMNYFSFNLYNVYRNYLDWQQLDLTAIIFIIRNIGQP